MTNNNHDPDNCPLCQSNDIRYSEKQELWVCLGCQYKWNPCNNDRQPIQIKLNIFLSYGHDEFTDQAKRIKVDLEKRGHQVWFDETEIREGSDFEAKIEEGLRNCDRVVIIMTPYSVRRRDRRDPQSTDGYCLNEIAKALQKNKLIIPILLVEIDEGPPTSICRIQYLDLRDSIPIELHEDRYCDRFQRLIHAIEYVDLDFEGGQAYLQRYLRPLNFDKDISEHIIRFTGRKWIIDVIDYWLSNEKQSRVFWLCGGPGIGKTAISSFLCHRLKEVIAFHLCIHGHDDKGDPKRALLSIAYQMAQHLPEYNRRIKTLELEKEVLKNTETLFDNLFVIPFSRNYSPPDKGTQYVIVIDGIDEAEKDGKNEIAEFIRDQWEKTPSWLRLIITSRPESPILSTLQNLKPYFFNAQCSQNIEDLTLFLTKELEKRNLEFSENNLSTIIEKSEGIFLYLVAVLDEIDNRTLFISKIDDFPQGLSGYYQKFFMRQFPNMKIYQEQYKLLIECIIAANDPLPIELIREIVGCSTDVVRKNLAHLGSLFPIRQELSDNVQIETVSGFHKSIADWLTGIDLHTRYKIAGDYAVDPSAGRKRLCDACWNNFINSPVTLSHYAIRHLPSLLIDQKRWSDIAFLLTDPGFIEKKCHSGMIFDLISDFSRVKMDWPDQADKRAKDEIKQLKIKKYIDDLLAYCEKPDHHELPKLLPSIINEVTSVNKPEKEAWTQFEQITAWGDFVSTHIGALSRKEEPFFQVAWNNADKGPVVEAMQQRQKDGKGITDPWLRLINRRNFVLNPICKKVLEGHTGWITSVAITPDGTIAVSGSYDTTIRVWNIKTSSCIKVLRGHDAKINCVAISANGSTAASASDDATVRIWDIKSGTTIGILTGHSGEVNAICLTPDGKTAVTGGVDFTVQVWDLVTFERKSIFLGHEWSISALCITPEGNRAISASRDKTLRVWDILNKTCIGELIGHTDWVRSVSITPDGKKAISGSDDKIARIWDVDTQTCLKELVGHDDCIRGVCMQPDGKRAVTVSWDTTLRVWDAETGSCEGIYRGHTAEIMSLDVSMDGCNAISAGADKNIRIWDLLVEPTYNPYDLQQFKFTSVQILPFDNLIFLGCLDNIVRCLNLTNWEYVTEFKGHTGWILSLGITPDMSKMVSGSYDGTIRVWDLKNSKCLMMLLGHSDKIKSLSISPDGTRVVSGSYDKTIRVWELPTGLCIRVLKGHSDIVSSVSFTPDGTHIISGSWDKTIRIWNLLTGECERILEGHIDKISSLSVSPDGSRFVTGSYDRTFRVWDLIKGSCLMIMSVHDDWVKSVKIMGNGIYAISASDDQTVRIWNIKTQECLLTCSTGHLGPYISIAAQGTDIILRGYSRDISYYHLENLSLRPSVVSAWQQLNELSLSVGCPNCRSWSEIPESCRGKEISCPSCGVKLKLTSFTINGEWRKVAKAWKPE